MTFPCFVMLISLILTGSWDQDTTCSTVRIQGLENVNSKDEFVYAALVYSTRMEGRLPKPVKKGCFRTYTCVHIPISLHLDVYCHCGENETGGRSATVGQLETYGIKPHVMNWIGNVSGRAGTGDRIIIILIGHGHEEDHGSRRTRVHI